MPAPITARPQPSAYPFESRFTAVDGFRIHYVEEGQGDPVLFVHGNPTSSYVYRNVLPRVARESGRRCIALDLLGFGKSDKPAGIDYDLALHARIVRGFIDGLGLRNPVLVAEDWGGPLSAHYAITRPENVQGLILMETFLWPMTWEEDFDPSFRTPFKLMRSPLGFVMVQVLNMMVKKLIPEHCPMSAETMAAFLEPFPTIASRRAMREFPKLLPVEGEPRGSFEFMERLLRELPKTGFPVAWIKARPGIVPNDDYPPSLKSFERFRRSMPRLTVKDFGPGHHFLAEIDPGRLSEIIVDWLRENRLTRR